jgi:FkbM family methyltransferase
VLSFEPNPAELSKILCNETDVEKFSRAVPLRYASIKYIDKALSREVGTRTLNITEGPGASSLLDPNVELIQSVEYYRPQGKRLAPQFTVVQRAQVETTTLDCVADQEALETIDYLKLDTQGTEIDCLIGASKFFAQRKIGVLKTEVHFQEMYRGQPLFADVDAFLRSRGFILLDLSFGDQHRVIWSGDALRGDRGTLLFADAFYALGLPEHRTLDAGAAVRHGFVAAELGFSDFALALLETTREVTDDERHALRAWWGRDTRSWKRKLKDRLRDMLRVFGGLLGE